MAGKNSALLMQAYQKVGLDEAFSAAIVGGGNAKHIVETWKADWRGENGVEHPAIRAVLEGHATPEQARSLLEAADLHRDLVEAVAAGTKSVEWAHIVLSAGFKGKQEAVSALLDGADSTIIAHILDVDLSDADAKAIGRGGSRRKKSTQDGKGITDAMIKEWCKAACVAELALAGAPYTGSLQELSEKLLRYRSFLEHIIEGLKTGKLQWKNRSKVHYSKGRNRRAPGNWQSQIVNGRRQNVWVASPQTVSYSGTTNRAGLREAGKILCFKGASKMTVKYLRTRILNQGLRFGFVDEDEYDDLLEGDSDFNKT